MKIDVMQNGPILIQTGGKAVVQAGGATEEKAQDIIALCRCGASANKPFCDGAHKGGFEGDACTIETAG